MKYYKILPLSFLLISFISGCATTRTNAEKQGWKLSLQSYTFHRFSLVEAIDKTNELGVQYIEVFPHQKLGGNLGDDKFNYSLDPEKRKAILTYAKSKNVKIVSTGVMRAKKDEWEKVFDFAKDMGMEYISAEPEPDDWDLVEELAIKNKIKVAVHNHPSESSYWNPDILLGSIQHRVNSIGACLDVGHYKRMGVEPLPAIKKLKGRIVSIHMKDILAREDGSKYDDVVWGNGELGIREILEELKRQNFKGYFTIEYEASWNNNIPEIEKSIEYFNKISDIIL